LFESFLVKANAVGIVGKEIENWPAYCEERTDANTRSIEDAGHSRSRPTSCSSGQDPFSPSIENWVQYTVETWSFCGFLHVATSKKLGFLELPPCLANTLPLWKPRLALTQRAVESDVFKRLMCCETTLTGESQFHISTPQGIWT
jgi:hypothetical protein